MTDRVTIAIDDAGVADVRLNRPEKMNALDPAMFDGIVDAIEQLGSDSSVRAVVLSGEGRAFCAGLDMASFAGMAQKSAADNDDGDDDGADRLMKRTYGDANKFQQVAWGWHVLPVPVIAAVHGVAFGGGFQIACGADIRVTAPDTRHAIMEMKWGLVPDMAGIPIVRNLARDDVVRELCYTARIFDGAEALDYGFATKLSDDPHADAMELAHEIASKSPDAVRANKRLLNMSRDQHAAEILLEESREQAGVIGKPNQIEAVMAGMAKRPGNFKDVA
ncbi:MAG: crotonase/enoyl-CoA hydratase family protein [Parasphingopyxis sp.]|uniref:crotonase/enoyl-CoA hydratase family protein n=1 Tax=Parasphingopyxis sp. TaxID=1920299 RepID=UPI003FA0E0E8